MSKEYPLISILVCNYNYSQYIEESLDSAFNQDYPNIEIIVIDDGSDDESVKIVESYAKNHLSRYIKVIAKKHNEGLCYARNDALAAASGEYFVFLDSDDTMPGDYVSRFYKTAIQSKADVVYGDTRSFGNENGETNHPKYSLGNLLVYNFINISSLVKRSKVGSQKFDVELNRKTLEDYDFWLGLGLKGLRFAKANGVYLNYRIQKESRNDNSSRLDVRFKKFIKVWLYCIGKYKVTYPDKVPEDIIVTGFDHYISQITNELYNLNDTIHQDLMPELDNRGRRVKHLELELEECLTHNAEAHDLNEELKASLDYRLGVAILKPVRILGGFLNKIRQ